MVVALRYFKSERVRKWSDGFKWPVKVASDDNVGVPFAVKQIDKVC